MQLPKDQMKALLTYSNYVNKNSVVVHFNEIFVFANLIRHIKYVMANFIFYPILTY